MVENNLFLGFNKFEKNIYLAGPNMGGKSTLLRMVGLNVILA